MDSYLRKKIGFHASLIVLATQMVVSSQLVQEL